MAAQNAAAPVRKRRMKHAVLGENLQWIFFEPAPRSHFQTKRNEQTLTFLFTMLFVHVVPRIAMNRILARHGFKSIKVMPIGLIEESLERICFRQIWKRFA